MRSAIIGGTGFYGIPGKIFQEQIVDTPYGKARVYQGQGENEDLFFLARHGVKHSVPPHRINYRANIQALKQLGVTHALATFAVGSLRKSIPPLALLAIDQFLDFTQGRAHTFFDGDSGLGFAHTDMTNPLCSGLRAEMLGLAAQRGLDLLPGGTYACTNGPRLETTAEVRMLAQLGGDVVGMTGVPEIPLAREAGLHYAAIAFVINYGAGMESQKMAFIQEGLKERKEQMLQLMLDTLRAPSTGACDCETALFEIHPPDEG